LRAHVLVVLVPALEQALHAPDRGRQARRRAGAAEQLEHAPAQAFALVEVARRLELLLGLVGLLLQQADLHLAEVLLPGAAAVDRAVLQQEEQRLAALLEHLDAVVSARARIVLQRGVARREADVRRRGVVELPAALLGLLQVAGQADAAGVLLVAGEAIGRALHVEQRRRDVAAVERVLRGARDAVARRARLLDLEAHALEALEQRRLRAGGAVDQQVEDPQRVDTVDQHLQRPDRDRHGL